VIAVAVAAGVTAIGDDKMVGVGPGSAWGCAVVAGKQATSKHSTSTAVPRTMPSTTCIMKPIPDYAN
jgi:hypothetical protein